MSNIPLRRDRHVGSQLLDDSLSLVPSTRPACAISPRQQQDESRPARGLRGPIAPTATQVIDVGPFPRPHAFLIPPNQIRGNSQHLELVRVEARRSVPVNSVYASCHECRANASSVACTASTVDDTRRGSLPCQASKARAVSHADIGAHPACAT